MSDEKALPPGDEGKADETLEIKSPVQPKEGALQPSADETQGTVLQDPTRRRDTNTASLKRLKPEDFNVSTDAGDEADQTETVNIKVIKEQKKQFRNMMTSSQTLAVEPETQQQMPAPAQAPQESSKATLKIKAPSQETRTESIPRPGAAAETAAPAPATQAPASPKSTLKIKAPAGMAPAQSGAAKPGATLKIKAPAAAPAAGGDAAAQTVQQAAPVRPGKTLKLKPGQAAAAPAAAQQPQRRQGAATKYSQAPAPAEASASPGIAYTICSVAGVAACIVALIKICTSLNDMFNTVNVFDSRYF